MTQRPSRTLCAAAHVSACAYARTTVKRERTGSSAGVLADADELGHLALDLPVERDVNRESDERAYRGEEGRQRSEERHRDVCRERE